MIEREVGWRIFAGEFNDSTYVLTGEEERSPTYLVSPLGAKINRVFAVGVITDLENLGSPAEPLWRARMRDPTGTFFISAGQFQPEAATTLSKLKPPVFAAVIGKVRTYSPEEGITYVSIRPEVIKNITQDVREYWVLDACKTLKERLEAFSEAKNMVSPSVEELMDLGYSRKISEGIIIALEEYENVPLERYQKMLVESLQWLLPEQRSDDELIAETKKIDEPEHDLEEEAIESITGRDDEVFVENAQDEDTDDEELTDEETALLGLVEKMDKDGSGAMYEDIHTAAKKAKLKKEAVEEAIMSLLDKGLVYEPVLGKIRKI